MNKKFLRLLLAPLCISVFGACSSGTSEVISSTPLAEESGSQRAQPDSRHGNLKNGVALEGYDAVSYFDGKPLKGSKQFESAQQGVTYRFANAENQKRFDENPEEYEPAYGGWCAWAIVDGDKVEVDPETYKISEGRLLLFYNGIWGNTLKSWNEKDESELLTKADENWTTITQE